MLTSNINVEITGLNDVPQAGDRFVVFEDEKTARYSIRKILKIKKHAFHIRNTCSD
ncbi:hypothetical protein EfmJHP36_20130 [Enterococcus faecium]|nr:hypothetical protein EfmJHP36_20130 [Enterococcus faecium]